MRMKRYLLLVVVLLSLVLVAAEAEAQKEEAEKDSAKTSDKKKIKSKKKKTSKDWSRLDVQEMSSDWEAGDEQEELEHEYDRIQRVAQKKQQKMKKKMDSGRPEDIKRWEEWKECKSHRTCGENVNVLVNQIACVADDKCEDKEEDER